MKRLKKSKRVSWASGAKLFQVKLFLSEDCPSKVGLQAQDHPQAKTWMSCSNSVFSDNHHSRFEGRHSMNPLKEKLSNIPQIKWKCPPKVSLRYNWHVAAGEESKEAATQKHREMRVLEPVYSFLSDIPPSPSLPLDVQDHHLDENHIPLIPIIPIEEEEGAVDLPSDMAAPQNGSFDPQSLALPALPQGLSSRNLNAPQCEAPASLKPSANEKTAVELLPGFQADVVVAAAAAISALMKSKEQVSLIDTDLLIKFLSDPKTIEKLISEQGAPASTKTELVSGSKPLTALVPLPSTKPGLVKEVINEDGALMKIRRSSISGSNLVSPSVAMPDPKPDPVIKNLTNEQGAAANTAAAPHISGSKLVMPSVALPCPNPDPLIEKLIHKHTTPNGTRAACVSRSKPVTSPVVFLCPRPEPVVKKLTDGRGMLTDAGSAQFSVGKLATPLASLPSSKTPLASLVSGSKPVTSSVAFPCPRPEPVVKKFTNGHGMPTGAGSAPFPGGKRVTPLASLPSSKTPLAAPVSGSKLVTSLVVFPCPIPEPVPKKLTNGHGMPTDAGSAPFSVGKLASLPSSKPDLVKLKRMINEYGTLDGTENTPPISRSMPSTLQVPMSSPKLDVFLPAWMNSHPPPNVVETGSLLEALLPEAARPNLNTLPNVMHPDFRLKAPSPDTARLNLHPLPTMVQPSLLMGALSPDTVPMASSTAMTMTAPPVKDINFVKSLIKKHGEMQETDQDYNLLQSGKFHVHLQDMVANVKQNESILKVQKSCIFFSSPRGCRNGANCLYRHDKPTKLQSGNVLEAPSAKRMKLGGEITGRT